MNKRVSTPIVILFVCAGIAAGQESGSPNDAHSTPQLAVDDTTPASESKEDELPAPRPMTPEPTSIFFSPPEPQTKPPDPKASSGPSPPLRLLMPSSVSATRPWTGASVSRQDEAGCFDDTTCLKPPTYCFWGGVEGLYWWEKGQPLPPNLVTMGAPSDRYPGALGQPNTQVVFGPNTLGYGGFIGVRAFAGMWLDPDQNLGFETTGFVLENRNSIVNVDAPAGGYPLLALRFDEPGGVPNAFKLSAPALPGSNMNAYNGGVTLQTSSQFWGGEDNLLHTLYYSRQLRLVALAGLRYLELSEQLNIQTNTSTLDNSTLSFLGTSHPMATQATTDAFRTRNQFYGGQLGLRGDYFYHQFFLRVGGTLALGDGDEVSEVAGITNFQYRNGLPLKAPGGLYALPSNSGQFRHDDFSIVPAAQVKGGVLLAPWCRVTFGFDFLYWSRVLRPGNQIDLTVDPREVPTNMSTNVPYQAGIVTTAPRPMTNPSDFWVQGLTFGLELTF